MRKSMWHLKTFSELSNEELYKILRLRVDVFVVEQECAYPELDGHDIQDCYHFYKKEGDDIAAYTRILAPGTTYPEASIGRVVTHPDHRGGGIGRELMERSIAHTRELYPEHDIKIGAQCYLDRFYRELGFEPIGDPYMEDGIEHIHMVYNK